MNHLCVVNLFHLDPAPNGGTSRTARMISQMLANLAHAGQVRVIFAVNWRFAPSFPAWIGYPQAEVIPCLPELGATPLLQRLSPDVVVSPLSGPFPFDNADHIGTIPHIVKLSDILWLDHPELLSPADTLFHQKAYAALPYAAKVVAASEYARQRVIARLGLAPTQIVTIHQAGDYATPNTHGDVSMVPPQPYIFYPANGWPHKRHKLLLQITKEIWMTRPDVRLVLAGYHEPGYIDRLAREVDCPTERIIDLGYINDGQLSDLYRHAEAMVFPSQHEAFGMPLLEAMTHCCPVICAPLDAIPEVAGQAALYVNSDDPSDWAKALLHELPRQRDRLIDKGAAQAQLFSWERTRQQWLNVLIEAGLQLSPPSNLPDFYEANRTGLDVPLSVVRQELAVWSGEYARLRVELEAKETEIRNLATAARERADLLLDKEAIIQAQQQELIAREAVIQSQQQELVAKEACIQAQHKDLLAKEAVIQGFIAARQSLIHFCDVYYLRPFLKRLLPASQQARLRQWRRHVQPKLGVLRQYPPRPLRLPASYHEISSGRSTALLPVVSIVTPSFNHARFLERTMQSVLDQQYHRLEYLVQDGASTDDTTQILARYQPRLTHLESCQDDGQANAINRGFRHATGEIMAWLNSDDLLLPGTVASVVNFFLEHPEIDVVYGHRIIIDEQDREIGRWVLPPHDDAMLLWADYIPQETLFWHRRIWDKAGGYVDESYHFALDWELLLRFYDAGAKFARLPRFLAAFRVHEAQKTSRELHGRGLQEMAKLRKQRHGREISNEEALRHSRGYVRRHLWYDACYRAGLSKYLP